MPSSDLLTKDISELRQLVLEKRDKQGDKAEGRKEKGRGGRPAAADKAEKVRRAVAWPADAYHCHVICVLPHARPLACGFAARPRDGAPSRYMAVCPSPPRGAVHTLRTLLLRGWAPGHANLYHHRRCACVAWYIRLPQQPACASSVPCWHLLPAGDNAGAAAHTVKLAGIQKTDRGDLCSCTCFCRRNCTGLHRTVLARRWRRP